MKTTRKKIMAGHENCIESYIEKKIEVVGTWAQLSLLFN